MDQEIINYVEKRINECDIHIRHHNEEISEAKLDKPSKENMEFLHKLLQMRKTAEAVKNAYMDIWTRMEGLKDDD